MPALKTWSAALTWAASLANGQTCNNTNLTDGSVAGQWRLPNIKEFSSLVNAGAYIPSLPDGGSPFTGVQSNGCWSSTTYAPDTSRAWYVYFFGGGVAAETTSSYYVWPVRGGL